MSAAPARSDMDPVIIAHRGYAAKAPENTLAAIEAALSAGARSVEWDVRVAKCGTPVLFHDATLDRTTTGSGPLEEHTAEALAALDAGSWFHPDFAGEPVPTLAGALERVAGRVDRIYPEIKAHGGPEYLDTMATLVRDRELQERTSFISMDWEALEHLGQAAPGVELGFIVEEAHRFREAVERARKHPPAFVDVDYRFPLQDASLAVVARERGVELGVWTVDTPGEAEAILAQGVPRITTNEVECLLEWARSVDTSPASGHL